MLYYGIGVIEQAQREYNSMGQYQQWLHHREIEQQLEITQAELEQRLRALQERDATLGLAAWCAENPIIEALVAIDTWQSQGQATAVPVEAIKTNEMPLVKKDACASSLDTTAAHGARAGAVAEKENGSHEAPDVLSPALLAWGNLPNFDSPTSSDTTEPQLELPWWLRNITAPTYPSSVNGPVDPESIRTNRLVQRWLERWGRLPQARPEAQLSDQLSSSQYESGDEPQ
jgi:hypothetical protein